MNVKHETKREAEKREAAEEEAAERKREDREASKRYDYETERKREEAARRAAGYDPEEAHEAYDALSLAPKQKAADEVPVPVEASINEPVATPHQQEPGGGTSPSAPTITALDPASCTIGDADFTLYIHGTGLTAASQINFAGQDEPATYNDIDGTLSTGIKPTLWTDPVVVQCLVSTGGVWSAPVDFEFMAPATRGKETWRR
jgi:hypothetical protein